MQRWTIEATVSSMVLIGVLGMGTSVAAAGGVPADFNNDGKTDRSFYRPADGTWHWRPSLPDGGEGPEEVRWWGSPGDEPLAGDFDGDGATDLAIFRPSTETWWVERSGGQPPMIVGGWGRATDRRVPADYDGDGKTDLAIFRPTDSEWWIHRSTDGGHHVYNWGLPDDVPVVADCDADGKADLVLMRPDDDSWWITYSASGTPASFVVERGGESVPADYDGDGETDAATYHRDSGAWHILESTTGLIRTDTIRDDQGNPVTGGRPVPGDYDGDRQADLALVIRGRWVLKSSKGSGLAPGPFFPDDFGTEDDIFVPWLALSGAPR